MSRNNDFITPSKERSEFESRLIADLQSPELKYNPYNAIMYGFPWGKPNTPLADMHGPRQWQREYLQEITSYYKDALKAGKTSDIFRKAVASGRGPGKSALLGMLAWFFMSTRLGGSVIVTANTEPQLMTKTMPEIGKWFRMAINSHWFQVNAMTIRPADWFAELLKRRPESGGLLIDPMYYYVSAQLWKEEVPDAFAGAHNTHGEVYFFDEASAIPQPIWTVTEGVFTENTIDKFFLAFSNPRQNTGPFFECFNKNRDMWRPLKIDTRNVHEVSEDVWKSIIKQFGEDSNEAKIEVYGEFPESTEDQFIAVDVIRGAMERDVANDPHAPLLMGVDVARSEVGDRTVLAFRKGRDARSIPWQIYKGLKGDQVVSRIASAIDKYNPDEVFVDGGGIGGPIIDMLRSLGYRIREVQAGGKPEDATTFPNKRVEMWWRMKEWLEIGCIPDNNDLMDDLKGPRLDHHRISGQMILESKKDMKKRGLASPDMAEALVQTYAFKVASKNINAYRTQTLKYPSLGVS